MIGRSAPIAYLRARNLRQECSDILLISHTGRRSGPILGPSRGSVKKTSFFFFFLLRRASLGCFERMYSGCTSTAEFFSDFEPLNSRFSGPQAAARPSVGDRRLVWGAQTMSEPNAGNPALNSYVSPRAPDGPERSRGERRRSNEAFHRGNLRESRKLFRQKVAKVRPRGQ